MHLAQFNYRGKNDRSGRWACPALAELLGHQQRAGEAHLPDLSFFPVVFL